MSAIIALFCSPFIYSTSQINFSCSSQLKKEKTLDWAPSLKRTGEYTSQLLLTSEILPPLSEDFWTPFPKTSHSDFKECFSFRIERKEQGYLSKPPLITHLVISNWSIDHNFSRMTMFRQSPGINFNGLWQAEVTIVWNSAC